MGGFGGEGEREGVWSREDENKERSKRKRGVGVGRKGGGGLGWRLHLGAVGHLRVGGGGKVGEEGNSELWVRHMGLSW